MIYFKANKDFPFGKNIPVFVEVTNSSYNFITHNWSLRVNYFLNEEVVILNKVKQEISKYIIEQGPFMTEEKINFLIEKFIDVPEIIPLAHKDINIFYAPQEDTEKSVFNINNIQSFKIFLYQIFQTNFSLLDVMPDTLKVYEEARLQEKIQTLCKEAMSK